MKNKKGILVLLALVVTVLVSVPAFTASTAEGGGDDGLTFKGNFGGSVADYFQSVAAVPGDAVAAGYSQQGSFGNGDWTGTAARGDQDAIIAKHVIPVTDISVTDITEVPSAATAGTPLTLTGTVFPSDASYKTITWSVKNAGTTGATISGDVLSTTATGTVTVTATISNGKGVGTPYTKDFTIFVNPAQIKYITATSDLNSAITPSGEVPVFSETSQYFAFTPNAGYYISSVTVDGVALSLYEVQMNNGSGYTFSNMTGDHTIDVKSAPLPTITPTSDSNSTISPSGTMTVEYGAFLNVVFSPNEGHYISSVTVNGVDRPLTQYTMHNEEMYLVVMTSDYTIDVKSAPLPIITATADSNSMVYPSGSVAVWSGSTQYFYFFPNTGYFISSVMVDGVALSFERGQMELEGIYIFSNVTGDHTIDVKSAPLPIITATADSNSMISPSGIVTVENGSSRSFTFRPSAGYFISSVTVDGVDIPLSQADMSSGVYTFSNVTSDHTIDVKSASLPVITATADSNSTISPSGIVTITHISGQPFTFRPKAGYYISSVTVDGIVLSLSETEMRFGGNYDFPLMTGDHTIDVKSAPLPIITATADSNSTISPSGTAAVQYGMNQSFTFRPKAGYYISSVTVDGIVLSLSETEMRFGGSYTFSNVTGDHTIDVESSVVPYFTITATADSSSMVYPGGTVSVLSWSSLTFSFYPNTRHYMSSVTVDGIVLSLSETEMRFGGSYTFSNVTGDHTIDVKSALLPIITATADSNSTISPSGAVSVQPGSSQTFIFSANAGYTLSSVTVDGTALTSAQMTARSYTFSNVTADHTIDVKSIRTPPTYYYITATSDPGATISPSGKIAVEKGTSQTFTFAVNAGYTLYGYFSSVKVDGMALSQEEIARGQYTFRSVNMNHTIEVSTTTLPGPFDYSITVTNLEVKSGLVYTTLDSSVKEVNKGGWVSVSFAKKPEHFVFEVKVDGVALSYAEKNRGSYIFNNVTSDHTIEIVYAKDGGITAVLPTEYVSPMFDIIPIPAEWLRWLTPHVVVETMYIESDTIAKVNQAIKMGLPPSDVEGLAVAITVEAISYFVPVLGYVSLIVDMWNFVIINNILNEMIDKDVNKNGILLVVAKTPGGLIGGYMIEQQ
ncbi:MAG: hypothetical protein FWG96_04670 [Methanomassiliicoccaceae archaeon]|nr:hypothetical protein [Methanomassiliicoccaceae archaeon]